MRSNQILIVLALFGLAPLAACGDASSPAGPSDEASSEVSERARTAANLELELPEEHRVELATTLPSAPARPAEIDVEVDLAEPSQEGVRMAHEALTLRRLEVTRSIEGREPLDPGTSFSSVQAPLFAFIDCANEGAEDQELMVTFEHESGRTAGHVALEIPAEVPRWRTWMRSSHVTVPGAWEAVVRVDGEVIGRQPFVVE
ncbi:MAG: hypothetical protein AAGF12_14240 [Myxococcota bacterium]